MSSEDVFALYGNMLSAVLPCAFVIGCCNIIVKMVLKAFFKGHLEIGGDL